MQSYTLEQLAKHYEATQSDVHQYVAEADYNKLAAKLEKLTCAVNDVLNGEADLTDLAEACDMKPERSLVVRDDLLLRDFSSELSSALRYDFEGPRDADSLDCFIDTVLESYVAKRIHQQEADGFVLEKLEGNN